MNSFVTLVTGVVLGAAIGGLSVYGLAQHGIITVPQAQAEAELYAPAPLQDSESVRIGYLNIQIPKQVPPQTLAYRKLDEANRLKAEAMTDIATNLALTQGQQAADEVDLVELNAQILNAINAGEDRVILRKVDATVAVRDADKPYEVSCVPQSSEQSICNFNLKPSQDDPTQAFYNGYAAQLTELLGVSVTHDTECSGPVLENGSQSCELTLTANWNPTAQPWGGLN